MIRLHYQKGVKMEYNTIFELHTVLLEMGIKHKFRGLYDGHQILIKKGGQTISFVEHMGSYGSHRDLIEAWSFEGEPEGYLGVFDCLEYLKTKKII